MSTKVILIARVSDVEQRKALPAQKLRLENYAKNERGLTKKDWQYEEFDESAYKDDRQKFAEMINKLQSMPETLIIVFDKIDRFTRDASQKEVRIMSQLVEKGKVELHFPSDNLYITQGSPATDLFRLGIGMLLAKYYSDSSRDNVKRRFQQMRNDGIWTHRAPVGYKNINRGTDKHPDKDVIVDKDKAHYIVKAFEMRARGLPYAVIARELGEMGFSSGMSSKPPSKAFLERILSNKFYKGIMVSSGIEYPHKYEPLISRTLFDKVQRVRDERKHEKTKYDSKEFTFKKIIKCGDCGRAVSPFKSRNTVYLRCANGQCSNPNTAESLVFDGVKEDVSYTDIPEEWLDKVVVELRKRHSSQQQYYTQNISQTRIEYDAIKGKMKTLYEDRLVGRITTDQYDEYVNKLEARQQELNDRLKLLTSDNKSFQLTASYLLDLAQRAKMLFKESDEALQNKLLEFVLSNIELRDRKLSYMLNEPFRTIVETKKKALAGSNSNLWCG